MVWRTRKDGKRYKISDQSPGVNFIHKTVKNAMKRHNCDYPIWPMSLYRPRAMMSVVYRSLEHQPPYLAINYIAYAKAEKVLTKSEFEDLVKFIIAHEMGHVEQQRLYPEWINDFGQYIPPEDYRFTLEEDADRRAESETNISRERLDKIYIKLGDVTK
jgi:hypothetical protein